MANYINRDALLQEIEQERQASKSSFPRQHFVVGDVLNCIRTAPAADVVEVRHGRWINPHWRNSVSAADCSECGAEAQHIEYRGVQKHYKICPSCGARMDKEVET